MTDARYPERWLSDRRILRLSDIDHRTFVTALVWAVSNRTDGVIEHRDLSLVVGATPESAAALVAAGLWAEDSDHWTISDFDSTQTSAHQLDAIDKVRRYDRERKALGRQSKAEPKTDPPPKNSTIRDDVRTENTGEASASASASASDRPREEVLRETSLNEEVANASSTFRRRPAA